MTEPINFIKNSLANYYGIFVTAMARLFVGADINASIYKVEASDQKTYFVKLRQGHVSDVNIAIQKLLQTVGIEQIIPPVKTIEGKYLQYAGDFTLLIYPFIEGQDGFRRALTDHQWIALGRALRQVHDVDLPSSLKTLIRRENFSSTWRDDIRSLYAHIEKMPIVDEITLHLKQFLKKNKSIIEHLVNRAEELGQKLSERPLKLVLCHSDIHGGNVLLDNNDCLYIVDWDEPILAPKERDLMFIGGGVGNVWNNPHEEKLFYQGYGETELDYNLMAYYRCERIVEDIAVYSSELPKLPESLARHEMYKHFIDMFVPNGVVDIAFKTHKI
jgi:spectinomycin phosphotransferase